MPLTDNEFAQSVVENVLGDDPVNVRARENAMEIMSKVTAVQGESRSLCVLLAGMTYAALLEEVTYFIAENIDVKRDAKALTDLIVKEMASNLKLEVERVVITNGITTKKKYNEVVGDNFIGDAPH